MRILGIDTATTVASVAIVENGTLVAENSYGRTGASSGKTLPQVRGNHAEVLLPLIESTLGLAGTALADLTGIAVSIGPGSFTGLRIGLATVKGIAYEGGLPVVGVSTLYANAARVANTDGIICSLLDARKDEVYVALYRQENGSLTRLCEDAVLSIHSVVTLVCTAGGSSRMIFVGDGATAHERLLASRFGSVANFCSDAELGSVAAQIARLSADRFGANTTDGVGALVPRYLRRAEAQNRRADSVLTC